MWQTGLAYKILPTAVGPDKVKDVELGKYPGMMELPVQSVVRRAAVGKDGVLRCEGFAWSGGGRGIQRVDVSVDGGATWAEATLGEGKDQHPNRSWAWTFWTCEINVSDVNVERAVCKAVDVAGNSQPRDGKEVWNVRGLGNNSWHWGRVEREDEWDTSVFG